jgi:hypothetical protein
MPVWDVFISHATEDKADVVLPLARALERAGLRVWLDRQELKLGDSLHEKIDEGLSKSRFGIVVLSPSFLAKRWPKKELDGLFTAEDVAGRTVILPVWHQMTKDVLAQHSPILAGRLAANTRDGIPDVARQVIDVVTQPGSGAPADVAPDPLRLFGALLERGPRRDEVVGFLSSYPWFVHAALGTAPDSDHWSVSLGGTTIDLAAYSARHSTNQKEFWLVEFGSSVNPLLEGGKPSDELVELIDALRATRQWVGRNLAAARRVVPALSPSFSAAVVIGRRDRLTSKETALLRRFQQEVPPVSVRTYDWIIDAAARRGGRQG